MGQPYTPKRELTLIDASCLVVGVIIGTGIYEVGPVIAAAVSSSEMYIALWLFGGLLSLAGALCYADLAKVYPREGGDYVYLSEAFGRWAGFLFAWAQVTVVRPGSIAAMAFPFAHYASSIYSFEGAEFWYASAAVLIMTAINIIGVKESKHIQNSVTFLKVLALLILALLPLLLAHVAPADELVPKENNLGLGLILVLFTYGGWNEIAYVASEVRSPEKNIFRALILGVGVVTLLYTLVNLGFLIVLGIEGLSNSTAAATDTLARFVPSFASKIMSVLICLSTLGAINGLVFSGARIYSALGREHIFFRYLGSWSERHGTPIAALITQAALSLTIVLLAQSFSGAVVYTTAVVWTFFLATGIAHLVERSKRPNAFHSRIGYPFTTILFCLTCGFLIWSAYNYDKKGTGIALSIVLAGLPIYGIERVVNNYRT